MGDSGNYIIIIILVLVAVIGIPIWLKKRKGSTTAASVSTRKNKDEVWKAVKQYLKDSNDYGKEIVDCYVAKRNSIDFVNPNLSPYLKSKKRQEIKIRKWQLNERKKISKAAGKTFVRPKEHELYVVCFTTRQIKTGILDKPRAIECEVINTRINKKDYDRKIIINGLLNYDKEMEWIAPIKHAETIKNAKASKHQQKVEIRKQKKAEKKKLKNKARLEKIKQKSGEKA